MFILMRKLIYIYCYYFNNNRYVILGYLGYFMLQLYINGNQFNGVQYFYRKIFDIMFLDKYMLNDDNFGLWRFFY